MRHKHHSVRLSSNTMRMLLLFLFILTSISAADETLYVSLYYPYDYIWVNPYQRFPVLTHYVIPVCLRTSGPERLTTPRPLVTSEAPTTPASTEAPTMTTTTRRGDN